MIWKLIWLFLIYSFAGWVLETVLASLKQKKFANRGIINGPFCLIYGFGGFFITAFTRELTGIWLFLGCAIVASLLEMCIRDRCTSSCISDFQRARCKTI